MKITILFLLTFSSGWLTNDALSKARDGKNWKPDALWVVAAVLDGAAVIVLWPYFQKSLPWLT